jgi:PEP-CTERM motif-containing protein
MRLSSRTTLVVAAFALALPAAAAPSLIGDDVTINWLFPDISTLFATTTVTVGAGVEVTCPGPNPLCAGFAVPATIDIGATSIVITEAAGSAWNPAAFNGLDFTSLDFGPGITLTGFSLSSDLAGLTPSRISFTDHSISFNAEDLSFRTAPYVIRLGLITSELEVPEPSTVALLGLALAAAVVIRRRGMRSPIRVNP